MNAISPINSASVKSEHFNDSFSITPDNGELDGATINDSGLPAVIRAKPLDFGNSENPLGFTKTGQNERVPESTGIIPRNQKNIEAQRAIKNEIQQIPPSQRTEAQRNILAEPDIKPIVSPAPLKGLNPDTVTNTDNVNPSVARNNARQNTTTVDLVNSNLQINVVSRFSTYTSGLDVSNRGGPNASTIAGRRPTVNSSNEGNNLLQGIPGTPRTNQPYLNDTGIEVRIQGKNPDGKLNGNNFSVSAANRTIPLGANPEKILALTSPIILAVATTSTPLNPEGTTKLKTQVFADTVPDLGFNELGLNASVEGKGWEIGGRAEWNNSGQQKFGGFANVGDYQLDFARSNNPNGGNAWQLGVGFKF